MVFGCFYSVYKKAIFKRLAGITSNMLANDNFTHLLLRTNTQALRYLKYLYPIETPLLFPSLRHLTFITITNATIIPYK